jgi:hypothetical protein
MHSNSVLVLLALAAFPPSTPNGSEKPMDQSKEQWFQLSVGQWGGPHYHHSDAHTRAQREVLRQITDYRRLKDVDEIERELDNALGDRPPTHGPGHGVHSGGSDGISFGKPDEQMVVWFQYDCELKGDARYLSEPQGLLLPMSEAEPLFRAWIASVRHWRALEAKHGVPLPADKWPTVYPPPAAN